MPAPTTLVGALLQAVAADATLQRLLAGGGAWRDTVPEEAGLPHVVLHDDEDPYRWVSLTSRVERHRVKVDVYALAAAGVGAANPAEVIADRLQAVWNWADFPLADCQPMRAELNRKPAKLAGKRGPAKERVFVVTMSYTVEFWRKAVAGAGAGG